VNFVPSQHVSKIFVLKLKKINIILSLLVNFVCIVYFQMQVLCARVQMHNAKELTNSTYRLCAVRTASAFRTTQRSSLQAKFPYVNWCGSHRTKTEVKRSARMQSVDNWQAAWDNSSKGRWTLDARVNRKHGQVDFYLTQALSGHGCFRSFLKRFGHDTENGCPESGSGIVEDDQHVLF